MKLKNLRAYKIKLEVYVKTRMILNVKVWEIKWNFPLYIFWKHFYYGSSKLITGSIESSKKGKNALVRTWKKWWQGSSQGLLWTTALDSHTWLTRRGLVLLGCVTGSCQFVAWNMWKRRLGGLLVSCSATVPLSSLIRHKFLYVSCCAQRSASFCTYMKNDFRSH